MKKIKISLRAKIIFSILLLVVALSVALVLVNYFTYKNATDKFYETLGINTARTVTDFLDEELMQDLVDGVEEGDVSVMETEEYIKMLSTLRSIRDSNDVLYIYIFFPKEDYVYYIFDADETDKAWAYGDTMEYGGIFLEYKEATLKGEALPSIISDIDENGFGWLITISHPYITESGKFLGYIGVDISMNEVVQERIDYLVRSILILVGVTVAAAVVYYILFNYIFVRPIKNMAAAASEFVSADNTGEDEGQISSSISSLDIKSNDELRLLGDSLKQMEKNLHGYITNLRTVTAERERIGAELDVATHIQKSMLPCIFPAFPDRAEFDIFATMNPAKEVGGDFYDFFMVDDTHIAVVMADVSGKGVPAALFMVIGKTLIKDHTSSKKDLGEVFSEVNELLCESNSEGLFITAFEGVLDLMTGELRYVNAGHEMPFICKGEQGFKPYKIKPGFVLAGMEGMKYRAGSITLDVGDKLFQYTDGVTEATDVNNNLYGMERLERVLNDNKNLSPAELLPAIKEDIDAFVGSAPQFDDITMLCLEYKSKPEVIA